jgi:hypothetical protein
MVELKNAKAEKVKELALYLNAAIRDAQSSGLEVSACVVSSDTIGSPPGVQLIVTVAQPL